MSFYSKLKNWLSTIFRWQIKDAFGVEPAPYDKAEGFIKLCGDIYMGHPPWLAPEKHIKTVNFAQSVCSEVARLATLGIGITIDGSARAEWEQEQIDSLMPRLRDWVEYGGAFGTVILKPNGESIDLVTPDRFVVTSDANGKITGVVFIDYAYRDERWYSRLEYHRHDGDLYLISNRCFYGPKKGYTDKAISIDYTPWEGLAEESSLTGVDGMLFGVLKMPGGNNIEIGGPLGLPIFSSAIVELEDLDIAYSRNANEIWDSKRTVLLDSDRLLVGGASLSNSAALIEKMELPDYVRIVEGTSSAESDIYHEINPTLNTKERLTGIDAQLSQIGFKCGFSNGYFVFNEKTGMVTATQVEADDRRTLQLISDVRAALKDCLDDLIYALDKLADLYGLAPRGEYEVTYDFSDVTENVEEDRARWWSYVVQGYVPAWEFFKRFEGLSEEEAKAIVAAAQGVSPLFAPEE